MTLLQLCSDIKKIYAKSFQGYQTTKKKDKNFEKNKSACIPPINVPSRKQFQQFSTY